jgi:hypothetical protein
MNEENFGKEENGAKEEKGEDDGRKKSHDEK